MSPLTDSDRTRLEMDLDTKVASYRTQCFAVSTQRTYSAHRTAYFKFCELFGYSPVPISDVIVCRYAAYLADRLCYNSIKQYLNIIRILHLEAGLPNPLDNKWILSTVLKGIAKTKGTFIKQKLPITPQLLLEIKGHLNLENGHHKTIWAACLTLFFSMLRKSNVFPQSLRSYDPTKHLRRCDFLIHPDGLDKGLVIQIRWTKTIQYKDRILMCPLPRLQGHPLCPVQAIVKAFHHTSQADPDGPAFMTHKSGKLVPMYYKEFITHIRRFLGPDSNNYTGHSFRRGGASWALTQGLPGESIKILGDWKSSAYLSYLTLDLHQKTNTMNMFSKNLPYY